MTDIEELRSALEKLDRRILKLLAERFEIAEKIGEIKEDEGMPVLDEKREEEVLSKWKENAEEYGLEVEDVNRILEGILSASKKVQHKVRDE
jgi:chorismate mutase